MKNFSIVKGGEKLLAILISLILALSLFSFVGCDVVETPEPVNMVYDVKIQYEGKDVDGQLTVDKSINQISLAAYVLQDGEDLPTYESSNPSVATIDSNGAVTLLSEGETVIKASLLNKSHTIVLIVVEGYNSTTTHTLTVNGGVAQDANGNTVTSAKQGDYLTLVPSMPAHKDFVQWQYSETGVWTNGNVIQMPAGDLTVTAEYVDTLYKLNLIGATATKANLTQNPTGTTLGGTSVENIKTVYSFAYGTVLTIKANTPDSSRLFVGWDQNVENNRVGEEGVTEYSFEMYGEDTTLTAIFSDIKHNILPGANVDSKGESTSIFTGTGLPGVTAKKITAGVIEGALTADPDLQSLYGYSFSIPGNCEGSSATAENITKSDLNTRTNLEPQTVKIIFKNRGAFPVTVELGYSYFGNVGSTGIVTVPAGGIVNKVFNSNIGLNDCSWAFSVRETVGGTESDVINLDVVAAAAQTYPTGYPLLNGSEDTQYLTFGAAFALKTGWKNGGNRSVFNDKGAQLFVSRASNMNAEKASVYAKITNLPAYDANNSTTTIYVQILNLVNVIDNPKNNFTVAISNSTDAFATSTTFLASEVVDIQEAGQVILLKLEIARSETEGDIYVHFVKTVKETGMEYNVLAQFAYNNAFGYQEA